MKILKTPIKKIVLIFTIALCALASQPLYSQPLFVDGVDDTPAAPIDDWIIPMIVIGVLLIFYYYKKSQKPAHK